MKEQKQHPQVKSAPLTSPALAGGSFTTSATGEAHLLHTYLQVVGTQNI